MRIFIAVAFIAIVAALGTALFFLLRDQSGKSRTVYALTARVALSVLLLLAIWFSWWMGWISPRSY
jgi:hypothetical protein